MSRGIAFNFSHVFDGVVWNMHCSSENDVILLEVRNHANRSVTFSAMHASGGNFLWRNERLEEAWWVSLTCAGAGVVLLTIYTDTSNPDKKAVMAYDLFNFKPLWWNNDFSVISVLKDSVVGYASKFGNRKVCLDLKTGQEKPEAATPPERLDPVMRPTQYLAENTYFATVKTFLEQKFNLLPVAALEYLEYQNLIFISCYFQEQELTNYLFIVSEDGNLLLKEKLDDHLKGIGLDTFFVLSGCVFFVRNKVELVSYKIV